MRVLILSDTHGHLHLINQLAEQHGADCVLHCGDFSLYSEERLEDMPERELALRLRHAHHLPAAVQKKAFSLSRQEKIALMKEHHLQGEFPLYLRGVHRFKVPVYLCWGNHEDVQLVNGLLDGSIQVPNLHLVNEKSDVVIGQGKARIRLVGIGGNFIHFTFFDKEGSDSFYPSMRFVQWIRLLQRFPKDKRGLHYRVTHQSKEQKAETEEEADIPLWMLTHVSPGKIPAMELWGSFLNASMWFSGHMGPWLPQHYSLFTNFEDYEFAQRTEQDVGFLKQLYAQLSCYWKLWHALEKLYPYSPDEKMDPVSSFQDSQDTCSSSSSFQSFSSWADFPSYIQNLLHLSSESSSSDSSASSSSSSSSSSAPSFSAKEASSFPELKLPQEYVRAVAASKSNYHLARRLRWFLFLEPHLSKEERKQAEQQLSAALQKNDSFSFKLILKQRGQMKDKGPFPEAIPTADEVELMDSNLQYFELPYSVPPGALDINNRANRTPTDFVKNTTLYFNLSDAYTGGYMLIDVDEATGQCDVQMRGTYPPPTTIVDPAYDPWKDAPTPSSSATST
ncbi:hypothetical protein QOT17_002574 [Balamuthia mandrillaris]